MPKSPSTDSKKRKPYAQPVSFPSMKRRAAFHNYHERGIYMITLATRGRWRRFGTLVCDPEPHISYTKLGQDIIDNEIPKISQVYKNVNVWQICLMPDHIHIILQVTEDFPPKKHLGSVVSGFKSGCNNAYWAIFGHNGTGLFDEGYNDRLLFDGPQLQHWKKYLRDNPRRLGVKMQSSDLFTTLYDIDICGRKCQITGNRFLLDNPDKVAVIVHNRDTDADFQRKKQQWLNCGKRGGVIISASIAKREKEVMREAMNRGYNLILLRDNGFHSFYKPSGESFNACASGQLLQICPWGYHTQQRTIMRQECKALNALAEAIVAQSATPPPAPAPATPTSDAATPTSDAATPATDTPTTDASTTALE